MPTPSEIRDALREQVSGLERLGGFNDNATHVLALAQKVLMLADAVVLIEAVAQAKSPSGSELLDAVRLMADAQAFGSHPGFLAKKEGIATREDYEAVGKRIEATREAINEKEFGDKKDKMNSAVDRRVMEVLRTKHSMTADEVFRAINWWTPVTIEESLDYLRRAGDVERRNNWFSLGPRFQ